MIGRVLILLSVVFWMGCSSGMKSGWGNFTAYYNTYYNAKKSYNAGFFKVESANINYNPQQPIRIHEEPINAGAQDFDKAIEKGAEILRKHSDTKWVDNSLFLIGKSYYFKKDFFSSDQKFQELAATTSDKRLSELAALWRARVFLEMELYDQGIEYSLAQLNEAEDNWNKRNLAELKVIVAQLYSKNENWEESIVHLEPALRDIKSKRYKERGYFLLGQLYERTGDNLKANEAFNKVSDNYYDYDLQYLALRKQAETARSLGNTDVALQTFSRMVKDDKNTEFGPELNYEIAKTYQDRGDFKDAEGLYKRVLSNQNQKPSPEIKALSYYGLAEIYRFEYDNFELAAAYYDTSSRQNAATDKLPEQFDANELAISFGEYSRLKNELNLKDSLLWVSNLSEVQFDSLLAELKKRKIAEIERERRSLENQQNTLINVSSNNQEQTLSGSNGFLNINNRTALQNASNQFRAVWGSRPLADNWRVRELLTRNSFSDENEVTEGVSSGQTITTDFTVDIDISQIPFSQEDKEVMRDDIARIKYELGNLFFLNLDMPDSAAFYFSSVIEDHKGSAQVPVSLYSLSEIKYAQSESEVAKTHAARLIDEYPNTRYAVTLGEKYSISFESTDTTTVLPLKDRFREISTDTSLTGFEQAEKLTELALANSKQQEAPVVLYEAIQKYIEVAKSGIVFEENYENWFNANSEWEKEREEFTEERNQAISSIQDTSLTNEERIKLQSMIDSTIVKPDLNSLFPYRGENWNKVRVAIDLFISSFRNSEFIQMVNALKSEFEIPKTEVIEEISPETELAETDGIPTCKDLRVEPIIRFGMDVFLENVNRFESEYQEIKYKLTINPRGLVEELELISSIGIEAIVSEYSDAIEDDLSFEPIIVDGEAITVKCEVSFPIRS